jgi:hypothetical protein
MARKRITKGALKHAQLKNSRTGRVPARRRKQLALPTAVPILEPEGKWHDANVPDVNWPEWPSDLSPSVSETALAIAAATAQEAASITAVEQALGELRRAIFGSDRLLPTNDF